MLEERNRVEKHLEYELGRRIVDVRPWGEKIQEHLSDPFNSTIAAIPLIFIMVSVPALTPICLLIALIAYVSVRSVKSYLPYRYPKKRGGKAVQDPRPQEKADGMLYLGEVRSSSPFEKFKEAWLSDNFLRKHWLILGTTGSGKSETLKGIFYNCLCWGSGFFAADGKADNKLPTDVYTMARAFGRDDAVLYLNFLLGGKTPQQIAKSARRYTNKISPFADADADTIIQMGANLLPKAEGEGKSWQEKALNLWRAVVVALCYKRDTQGMIVSIGTFIEYLSLNAVEDLYIEGFKEAQENGGIWSYGFAGVKNYLDSGCPSYQVEKLLNKHGLEKNSPSNDAQANKPSQPAFGRMPHQKSEQDKEKERKKATTQEGMAYEQHAYRTGQLMPVLNLLDKTYSHIFRDPFSEIDMNDVALHNRILLLLIPSLEKSAQEAENLGKLTIACLRVMMAKNLGAGLEGTYEELLGSKATNAKYPYVVSLDELGYFFSDGIAVMFAQARSLGMSLIAAAQDLEKLTEGTRAAEAGAMMANTSVKIFMKNEDPKKTWEFQKDAFGKATVATYATVERGLGGFTRSKEVKLEEVDRISYREMNTLKEGQAVVSSSGTVSRISTFYMGDWLTELDNQHFFINRFLQIKPCEDHEVDLYSTPVARLNQNDKAMQKAIELRQAMLGESKKQELLTGSPLLEKVSLAASLLPADLPAFERGILLYLAAKSALGLSADFPLETSAIEVANTDAVATGTPPAHEAPAETPQAPLPSSKLGESIATQPGRVGLLSLLYSPQASTLDANRDASEASHGSQPPPLMAPNPMALIRKGGKSVLGLPAGSMTTPAAPAPAPTLGTSSEAGFFPSPDPEDAPAQPSAINAQFPFPNADVGDDLPPDCYDDSQDESQLDTPVPPPADLVWEQAEAQGATPLPESVSIPDDDEISKGDSGFIAASLNQAHDLLRHPKSDDGSVVGIVNESMQQLVDVEALMGNPMPEIGAHVMQQIVAVEATPVTKAQDPSLDGQSIDEFFDMLEGR